MKNNTLGLSIIESKQKKCLQIKKNPQRKKITNTPLPNTIKNQSILAPTKNKTVEFSIFHR